MDGQGRAGLDQGRARPGQGQGVYRLLQVSRSAGVDGRGIQSTGAEPRHGQVDGWSSSLERPLLPPPVAPPSGLMMGTLLPALSAPRMGVLCMLLRPAMLLLLLLLPPPPTSRPNGSKGLSGPAAARCPEIAHALPSSSGAGVSLRCPLNRIGVGARSRSSSLAVRAPPAGPCWSHCQRP
ncbi:hypothetical protein T440DRAFT_179401 [Plenodomus tracheiphilus IPT5]|uniref:Uncharacterized protein n=1 Tax=Plenodomus tracheiphilus IPT5 TaxID=1408161 RepID=A0A6A7B0K6_9PLEO|nr:hypothetical protein T440DRAFT_179401 [Plenodomus tracheiphilus IPT5]